MVNAANEIAVKLFLDGVIGYDRIPYILEEALAAHAPVSVDGLETIERVDAAVRAHILKRFG